MLHARDRVASDRSQLIAMLQRRSARAPATDRLIQKSSPALIMICIKLFDQREVGVGDMQHSRATQSYYK